MNTSVYYRSFIESGGELFRWDSFTLILYVVIILFAAFIGWIIEKRVRKNLRTKPLFLLLFVVLAFFLGFRGANVGIDTIAYRNAFDRALDANAFADETTEPGYQLLMKGLRLTLPNADWAILLLSSITVFFIINTLWRDRKEINVFVAVLFYVGFYYFQAMSLLRIYLATAFIIWGFHYLIDKQYIKYIAIILAASLFHFSSLVMLLPLVFLFLYKKNKFFAIIVSVLGLVGVISISSNFGVYMSIARYASYADTNESSGGIGLKLFFDYLPSFFLLFYIFKNKKQGHIEDLIVTFSVVGFFIRIIAYYITIAGRLSIQFMPLYLILIPYYTNRIRHGNRKLYPLFLLFLVLYAIVRTHYYFMGYLSLDGIMPYNFVWSES